MALSLDTTIGGTGFISAETSVDDVTTASFDTAANVRLVALCASNGDDIGQGGFPQILTVSGAGGGWTREVEMNVQQGSAEIWVKYSASPLSSVTVTCTMGNSSQLGISLTVVGLLGAEVVHGGAEGINSDPSEIATCDITTNRDNSMIFHTMSDWAATGDPTIGTSFAQTKLNGHHFASFYSAGQGRSTNTVAAGTYTTGWQGTGRDFNMAAIEIREDVGTWEPETNADETIRILTGNRW